ncbi:MAG: ATP-binding cassette domain-containing protein, partial [Hamadaea sp.]|nr:ATP-binding cassette domain-containing protein [Hamadaea sp.]
AARKRTEIAGSLNRLRPLLAPLSDSAPLSSAQIRDARGILGQDSTHNRDRRGEVAPGERRAEGAGGEPEAVELRGVTVRYRAGGPAALDDFSLQLAPGSRTALVGPSGAGKSTVLAVLSGALTPTSGEVRYGGTPLPPEPHTLIGGLFADAAVFHASVAENVTLGRESTPDELTAAARAAGLLDWIEAQPDGWDTLVGEEGAALSGGQRQRLTLARALLHAPPVLVLDEPTEGLDPGHADAVLRSVLDHAGRRTVVVVTHRMAETAGFDQVVTLA